MAYVMPDYVSQAEFSDKEAYDKALKEQKFGSALVRNLDRHDSFEKAISGLKNSVTKVEKSHDYLGLEKEIWFKKRNGNLIKHSEVYYERDQKKEIVSFIRCSTIERVPFPSCDHKFIHDGLYYDVNYHTPYLATWKNNRSSIIRLIESFKARKPN